MKRMGIAAAAVSVLLLAFLAWWRLSREEDLVSPIPAPQAGTAEGRNVPGGAAPAPVPAAPAASPPPGPAASQEEMLRGRVVNGASEAPVAVFSVGFLPDLPKREAARSGFRFPLMRNPEEAVAAFARGKGAVAFSDAEGRFALPRAARRDGDFFVAASGYRILVVRGDPFGGGEEERVFRLSPRAGHRVRFLDNASEAPVEGVEIRLVELHQSDVGSFLEALGRGAGWPSLSEGSLIPRDALPVCAPSRPDGTVELQDLLDIRAPSALERFGDGHGSLLFSGVFLASREGWASVVFETKDAVGREQVQTIHLDRRFGDLLLEVVDGATRPVAAELQLEAARMGFGFPLRVRTSPDGRFRLPGAPLGPLSVRAWTSSAPGGGEGRLWGEETIEIREGTNERRLRLGREGTEDGCPVLFGRLDPDPDVAFIGLSILHVPSGRALSAALTGGGRREYRLPLAQAGAVRVEANFESRRLGGVTVNLGKIVLAEGERRCLDLLFPDATGLVEVTFRVSADAAKSQRLPTHIEVSALDPAGPVFTPRRTFRGSKSGDEEKEISPGSAFRTWLAPGAYRVRGLYLFSAGSWFHVSLAETGVREGSQVVEVSLPWVSLAQLAVTDRSTGRSLEEVRCRAFPEGIRDGEDGEYLPGFLRPGAYDLLVAAPGYRPARSRFVVKRDERDTLVELALEPGAAGVLAGRIVDSTIGEPIPCELQLFHAQLGEVSDVVDLQAGRFRFEGLPEGSFVLRVYPGGDWGRAQEFPLALGVDEVKDDLVIRVR